jgi:hypothetical protein
MARLDTDPSVVQCSENWKCLRKEPGLYLLCNFPFLAGAPFDFQLLSALAALALISRAHLIGADQIKRIPVCIGKRQTFCPIIGARRVLEMYSTTAPQLLSAADVFDDKSDVRIPADELWFSEPRLGQITAKIALPSGGAIATQRSNSKRPSATTLNPS